MTTNKRYVATCTCNNKFQDITYGKQVRLCTPTTRAANGVRDCRCTVCLKVHQIKDS